MKRVAGSKSALQLFAERLESLRVFPQRHHGLALVLGADVAAVLQGIELGVLLAGRAARPGRVPGVAARRSEQLWGKLG
jgi:hypothetical protein